MTRALSQRIWRFLLLLGMSTVLAACGGGGSDGGGFLPSDAPEPDPTPPSIVTTGLDAALQGLSYTTIIEADEGAEPYTWAILDDGGTGFVIDNAGIMTGTGPSSGDYGLTLQVTGADGAASRTSFILQVVGAGGGPQVLDITTPEDLPDAEEGESYTILLAAVGGEGNYMWTLTDDGGTGLNLRDDGLLSGTSPAIGDYALTVSVMDNVSEVIKPLLLTVAGNSNPLEIATTSLPSSTQGERYAAVLNARGGTGDYVWSLANSGGAGLSLSSDGVLSGVTNAVGTFGLSFQVTSGSQTAVSNLLLTVEPFTPDTPPVNITTPAALPDATGPTYAAALAVTGGTPPYNWTLIDDGGSGLTLSSSGALTGTTPPPGLYGLAASVADSLGEDDAQSFTLNVQAAGQPLTITTTSLGTATRGQTYTSAFNAIGGEPAYTWTLFEMIPLPTPPPGDPNGLQIDANTGFITWRACDIDPAGDGDGSDGTVYSITIQVDDSAAPANTAFSTLPLTALPDDPNSPACP